MDIKKLFFGSDFAKSVLVLTSGTVLAQVLSYALAPLITRLYTPEEMGEFGIYLRIVTFISILATARYDLSLPLPKNDSHSFQLFRLSLRIGLVTTVLTALGVFVYWTFTELSIQNIVFGIGMVIGTYFLLFYNVGTNWAIRTKQFRFISYSKIIRSGAHNGLRLLFGALNWGAIGLIIAFVISVILSTIYFLGDYLKNIKHSHFKASKRKMKALSKEYIDFPKISLPHTLVDNAREVLIALCLVYFFNKELFGSFDHSFRMLKLPMMLVGAAMGQVFFNEISVKFSNGQKIYPLVRKMMLYLAIFSIPAFAIIFFWGEPLFAFVFGAEWAESGKLSEIMAPWLLFNFISSPISSMPIVVGEQRSFFFIGLTSSILQIIGFGLLPYLNPEWGQSYTIFYFVSISQAVMYIYIIYYLLNMAKRADLKHS